MAKLPERRAAMKAVSTFTWQSILLCQSFALGVSPLLPLTAMAQGTGTTGSTTISPGTTSASSTTILPTDVVPLADREAYKTPIGELLQLKIMQRLPSNLYFSSSVEVTGRDETNPFQFPLKRTLEAQLPKPAVWRILNANEQSSLYNILGQVARNNAIFRVLPNVSGGWAFTPHTRLFTNYFMIRDQLTHNMRLNTVIHSYAIGMQHDWALGSKGSLQAEIQGRELWQLHQQSVFDFLPGVTLSYIMTPRMVLFVNALMQIRGKSVCLANGSMKEIDPFFTWGSLYQKNGWTFSVSSTFVQNFREPFHHSATIPKNSYVMISDFEIARRIVKQYPGLQAFMRAEPIWNFHSHNTPSLAGMDFRMFFGMRFAMAKPPLTATLEQIREQLKQETVPEGPTTKPSAELPSEPEIAMNPQPIHGFIESSTLAETCQLPDGEMPVIAEDDSSEESGPNNMIAQEPAANQQESAELPEMAGAELAEANSPAAALASEAKEEAPAAASTPIAIARVEAEKELPTAVDAGLKELSEKTERDYKLAFSSLPAPLPMPAASSVNSQIPALKALPASLLPSGARSTAKPVSSKPLAPPASSAVNSTMAFIYVPPKPAMPRMDSLAAGKLMQPLQQKTARSYSAELPPSALKASDKKGNNLAPVPVMSKPQPAAPNSVPAPVSAKLAKPLGILPSVSGEQASIDTAIASQKTSPVKHLTNKDGSIAISEAKMDSFENSAVKTATAAESKPQKIASTPVAKNQILQPAESASPTQKAEQRISSLPAANPQVQEPAAEPARQSSPQKLASQPASGTKVQQPAAEPVRQSAAQKIAAQPVAVTQTQQAPDEPVRQSAPQKLASRPAASTQIQQPPAEPMRQSAPQKLASLPATSTQIQQPPAEPMRQSAPQKLASLPAASTQIQQPPAEPMRQSAPQKLASLPAASTQMQQPLADVSHQNSARENELLLANNKITKLLSNPLAANPFRAQSNPLSLPVLRSTTPTPATSVAGSPIKSAPQLSLKTPLIPSAPPPAPDGESNPMAVSGLSEEEISSSPKIAMAVYDSWQSPVLDEPLIEDASSKLRRNTRTGASFEAPSAQLKQHAKPDKKRTDMKLIPPFPTATKESKDNPLKDLKIPVLPVR